MASDDADRLGPKGHVFVERVREEWRAPLERGSARRALLTATLAAALIGFGVAGLFVAYGESVILCGIGVVALYTTLPELRALRPEFEEARRIGWVEPSLDDNSVTIGEPATFRAVLHARRDLRLVSAAVRVEARTWNDAAPGAVLATIPAPVSDEPHSIRAGQDWREAVTFRIPPSAPASYYGVPDSTRWTLTLQLQFADEAPWQRTWSMLVFPADTA
jgi:hypothetical protein